MELWGYPPTHLSTEMRDVSCEIYLSARQQDEAYRAMVGRSAARF
jgi:hypothetical protein